MSWPEARLWRERHTFGGSEESLQRLFGRKHRSLRVTCNIFWGISVSFGGEGSNFGCGVSEDKLSNSAL